MIADITLNFGIVDTTVEPVGKASSAYSYYSNDVF